MKVKAAAQKFTVLANNPVSFVLRNALPQLLLKRKKNQSAVLSLSLHKAD